LPEHHRIAVTSPPETAGFLLEILDSGRLTLAETMHKGAQSANFLGS